MTDSETGMHPTPPPGKTDDELATLDVTALLRYGIGFGGSHRTALFGDGAVGAAVVLDRQGVLPRAVAFLAEVVRSGGTGYAAALPSRCRATPRQHWCVAGCSRPHPWCAPWTVTRRSPGGWSPSLPSWRSGSRTGTGPRGPATAEPTTAAYLSESTGATGCPAARLRGAASGPGTAPSPHPRHRDAGQAQEAAAERQQAGDLAGEQPRQPAQGERPRPEVRGGVADHDERRGPQQHGDQGRGDRARPARSRSRPRRPLAVFPPVGS
ncbi:hypothetical protein O1L68_36195 [Streptomyces lydicus]|nr:hypothetical protein [Streptomyces lydicus]